MKKRIINFIAGKFRLQKYFELLHLISLYGMNYGNGGNFRRSGEYFAAQYVKSKLLKEGTEKLVLFDVGANIGHYSTQLANIFSDKKFTIHSFEPSKKTFASFINTTSAIPYIVPNNFGFSDTETSLLLYTNDDASMLASLYERNLGHIDIFMDKTEVIKLTTIDSYCTQNKIGRVHFLKLDIEGHELNALKGAMEMINSKKINFIQFEFGGCNIDSRTFFQDFWYLLKDNYHFFRIVKDGIFPITSYKETLEIFTTINYLLELK